MKRYSNITRDTIPNFGDPKAVVREHRDKHGKTQKIEVFYGGVSGGDSAGHGHYVAERINGLYQVTLDREPDRAGGAHRIEKTHRTNAYSDESRSDRIRKKKEIIAQLRYLSPSDKDCFDKVKALSDRFYAAGSCGYADNQALKQEFQREKDRVMRARNELRAREKAEREAKLRAARQRKETIVGQAERLASASDPRAAKQEMRSLMDQWKAAPRASREDEEQLYRRFSAARTKLNERAQRDREERQRQYQQRQAEREQRQREFRARTTERLSAKQEQLRNLEAAISRTQDSIRDVMNRPPISPLNPHRYEIADRRNAKLSNLNQKLSSMQQRKQEVIRQIAQLQEKLR